MVTEAPPKDPATTPAETSPTPTSRKRKIEWLILSYKGLTRALSKGEITIEDLNQAIMHFGKMKDYIFYGYQEDRDDPFLRWYPKDRELERIAVRKQLHDAILKAEYEGRIIWRVNSEKRTWKKLNMLLIANGYKPLTVDPHTNYNKTAIILELRRRGETLKFIHD